MDRMIRRHPRVVSRSLSGEEGALLLDVETTAYHRVNRIGALIWQRLEAPSSVDELVTHVRQAVTAAGPELREEVVAFVDHLAKSDLVIFDQALEPSQDLESGNEV